VAQIAARQRFQQLARLHAQGQALQRAFGQQRVAPLRQAGGRVHMR
jgi:hypothetical protein